VTSRGNICIVTCDIVGPIRNGGIGTAYYNLALALSRAGHRVTVLYALGRYCESKTIAHWVRHYRRLGITFVPLERADVRGHDALKISYSVYRWLQDKTFDVVHCHEWRGVGFYTALARRQGLCLESATLCVGTHSPSLWHLEGMNETADADALEVDFMERETVARADVLWSPSRYMASWMQREGWRLRRRVLFRHCLLLDAQPAGRRSAGPRPELVFFGRLESRKGLELFCDALDRLAASGESPASVTFLGKPSSVGGVPSGDYLAQRGAQWPFSWRILGTLDRDAAMAYLREPGRVAVLPSRVDNLPYTVAECLADGIPFIASATGGIPEMICTADRARVLFSFSAGALAERLARIVRDGFEAAAPAIPASRTHRDWLRWHDVVVTRTRRRSAPARRRHAMPLVSVCLTHHNRPQFLAAALESIRRQDYPRVEVVLVDDGSDRPDAIAALDALEREFRARRWTLVRQPNRYLGAARNAAVAAARGRYVLFMDDDNLALPHEISTFVRAAQRTGADILTCSLRVFQSDSPAPGRLRGHVWPFLGGAMGPGLRRNVFGDANAFFRRDVFARIGGFTEDVGVGCEDWEIFARAVLRGLRLEVVPEPLVMYRQSPRGMLSSTSRHANEMRALRPYLGLMPPPLRPLVHLARQPASTTAPQAVAADHVTRAIVFGSGEAGRLAIELATRCGWTVPWIVDNNPMAWTTSAHGRQVRAPETLTVDRGDLVIVASLAGKPAISGQLERMGLRPGADFVHFLDPVRVGGLTMQVSL
jgi:glycosyltransferase involved in cell wall biosynthesis/GT2 family glycosyltransferase